jgi:DNA-binding SARP family transcriptional activator/ATP/maltotriose-dependent transcriptional regulator MalT
VHRERLIGPILSSRPSVVLIAAPSGYGKTVLAAQIAGSSQFRRVLWIDGSSCGGALRDSVRRLAEQLASMSTPIARESEDLFELAAAGLVALPDDQPVVIVFDDVDWAHDAESLQVVADIAGEAPPGSVCIVTSRQESTGFSGYSGTWRVGASDLLLTADELADLLRRTLSRDPDSEMVERLARDSSGHAALASLLVRRRSIARPGSALGDADSSVSALVEALVGQLEASDRQLLDMAAVMGSGVVRVLARCAERDNVPESLSRIARVLPLVTLTTSGADARYSVHDLVRFTLAPAASLAASDAPGLMRAIRELAASGSCVRALDAATASGTQEAVSCCLKALSTRSTIADQASAVADALDMLPALEVARDSRLLLLRAQVQWERYELSEAIRVATLAASIAEHDGDGATASRARAQVLTWRSAVGDLDGVASQALAFLDAESSVADDETWAGVLTSGALATGMLGDRCSLERFLERGRALCESAQVGCVARARMENTRGVVHVLLDGCWSDAVMAFRNAVAQMGASLCASSSHQNLAAALLEQGMLEDAKVAIAQRGTLGLGARLRSDALHNEVLLRTITLLQGAGADWKSAVERALDDNIAAGDRFSATSLMVVAPRTALCIRDFSYALALAERGVSASVSTGSPLLMWYAELAHAQACLASGDAERARSTALRVLPLVEGVGAMGHVLHSRMILSETARAEGDLAGAVEHLAHVSDYIVDQSPALTVASYLRAFPAMLGPLALAMGVDRIPVRVLNLLPGIYGEEALEQAAVVLTPAECAAIGGRMRREAKRVAERAAAADLSDAVCRVTVLGRFEVVAPHGPVADRDWGKRKARLLFAMLVARAGTDVPRGEIIEYLWPEMDEERALNNFYVVWSAMKRALAPNNIRETPCPFVEHAHGVCRVVPGRVVTDLDEFAAHLAAARRARNRGDAGAELSGIRAAEEVYRGDVLPGDIYDDWFAPVRSRYRREFEDAMLRAAQILQDCGEPHEGLSMLRRPMDNDVLREDFYQAALRLQIAAGQRSAAIETYMSCRNRLVEDLGIDPSRETTALYEQVLGMEEGPAK